MRKDISIKLSLVGTAILALS